MKNKETIIGWALIIVLMIGYVFYSTKKFDEDQKKRKEQQKTEQVNKAKEQSKSAAAVISSDSSKTEATLAPVDGKVDSSKASAEFGPLAAAANGEEKLFVLENDVIKL